MSGWQLGLVLFGCWLAGVGCGLVLVVKYAQHVYRQKVGQLVIGAEQHLTTTSSGGGSVEVKPPPPRPMGTGRPE